MSEPRMKPIDPVHCENGKWWFWDETWADRYGPYASREEAQKKMEEYSKEVLGQ